MPNLAAKTLKSLFKSFALVVAAPIPAIVPENLSGSSSLLSKIILLSF